MSSYQEYKKKALHDPESKKEVRSRKDQNLTPLTGSFLRVFVQVS